MAVDPARVVELARSLAKDVLELSEHFPPAWDGGDPGYLASGMCGLAEDILSALSDAA